MRNQLSITEHSTMTPNEVQITVTLALPAVNLVLAGLGKLPYEQVDSLVNGLRSAALQALQAAEEQANQTDPLPVLHQSV